MLPADAVIVADGFNTGSEVMDDILEHSQARMLEAIERLADRVNTLALADMPTSVEMGSASGAGPVLSSDVG